MVAQLRGHERAALAQAVEVQRLRDQLLARARLARDEHRHVRGRQPADHLEQRAHDGRLAHHVAPPVAALDLGAQAHHLRAQRALGERLLDRQDQLIDLEGLGDVVERAELHGADGGVDRAEGRDRDDVRRGGDGLDLAQHVESVEVRHLHVGDDEVDAAGADAFDARAPPAHGLDGVAVVLERLAQEVAHLLVVLDDEVMLARSAPRARARSARFWAASATLNPCPSDRPRQARCPAAAARGAGPAPCRRPRAPACCPSAGTPGTRRPCPRRSRPRSSRRGP